MEYLAHVDKERKQTMKEHLEGTAQLAKQFANSFGKGEWGYCCGILHDIGKYSNAFQKRIRGENDKIVDHSTAGAQLCLEKEGYYQFMSYCIAGHHAGLPDYGNSVGTSNKRTLLGRKRKKIEDYQAYKKDITIPNLTSIPFDAAKSENQDFSLSVFIRMIFSCLVDADFLDTENFMKHGETSRDAGEEVRVLLDKLMTYVSAWLSNENVDTLNGRRSEILRSCLKQGKLGRGLFRLTVPTGGGKTIASLAFALRHAVKNHMERIIYVVPYTSIIEQNAEIFREILGEENVLEDHYNVDYDSTEELKSMQLASENWDKPVIVTTNVQFFESLFGNKSSKCRKLHNISNSIIIFDEAQMLPNDYLKPCTMMMEELLSRYKSSIVLCTATQPALTSFFSEEIESLELCPRMEEQFQYFERVSFKNIGKVTTEDLLKRLEQEKQVLCIVNTKKRAQTLYQEIKGEGVYHLSTAMYPKHRRRVLQIVRKKIKEKQKCILIATSLVEAGVDLDFQSVYRQLAGVDSIIQAAGRCNREGKRKKEDSKVLIFSFKEKEYIPGQRQQIDITESLMAEGKDIFSLEGIEEYFKRVYFFKGKNLDKKGIIDEFKNLEYNFAKVGKKFKLIEQNTKTLFIHREETAEKLLQELKNQGYTRARMRKVGQYCIQVYDREFELLQGAGMLRPVDEEMKDFYELVDLEGYKEEIGLDLEIDSGMAILM